MLRDQTPIKVLREQVLTQTNVHDHNSLADRSQSWLRSPTIQDDELNGYRDDAPIPFSKRTRIHTHKRKHTNTLKHTRTRSDKPGVSVVVFTEDCYCDDDDDDNDDGSSRSTREKFRRHGKRRSRTVAAT